jgi:hypothetical protein
MAPPLVSDTDNCVPELLLQIVWLFVPLSVTADKFCETVPLTATFCDVAPELTKVIFPLEGEFADNIVTKMLVEDTVPPDGTSETELE